jgi:hypothetical protein
MRKVGSKAPVEKQQNARRLEHPGFLTATAPINVSHRTEPQSVKGSVGTALPEGLRPKPTRKSCG